MDNMQEHENGQPDDEDDIVVFDDSDLSDPENFYETDDSALTFKEHYEPVFCCNIDNEHGLVVSGGKDDVGFVWNMANGETVLKCTGHEDSVICVGFNHDSSLVATGDMSGIIQVWDVQNKSRIWDSRTSDLKWLQWHPERDTLIAGTVCGNAWLWHIPASESTIFPGSGAPSSLGRVIDGDKMITGYDNGAIKIWDLSNATVLQDISGHRAHNGPITAIDYGENGLILSGSVDCTAKLSLAANGKVINTFKCGDPSANVEDPDSVESVAFLKNQQSFVTGTLHGSLAVWDIGSHVQKLNFKQESGVVKVICPRDSPLLFTAGLDGVVRLFDGRTGNLEVSWKGHDCEILDFDLTRDEQTIVTASEDGTCKVFRVGQR